MGIITRTSERLLFRVMLKRSVDGKAAGICHMRLRHNGTTIGVTMLIRQGVLTEWTKSSYSAVNGDCVEVKSQGCRAIAVRDSKAPHRPCLDFSAETWSTFIVDISSAQD